MIHATVFALDFGRLVAFYQLFGFVPGRVEAGDFAILEDGDSELTIVQIPAKIARHISVSDPPKVRSETPIKLTFIVASLDAAVAQANALGGTTADFVRWSTAGYDVQDCVDPEGNVYQLRQTR